MSHLINAMQSRLGIVLIAGILTMYANPCTAQILVWPPEDEPPAKAEPAPEEEIKVLQISPAPEPEPALQYRFWPIAGEETPGNAMTLIQRANLIRLEQRLNNRPDAFYENYEQWMEGPLDEMPRDQVREYLKTNQAVLAEIHRAALMADSEYELGLQNLPVTSALRLSFADLQNARDLARLLTLDIRLALSEQRFDDAIRSLRSGLRLAEAIGQATDLLIGRLIGFAITGSMLNAAEELVTQPESPNLYWALASLPPSVWEIRQALEYDANLTVRMFPNVSDLPQGAGGDPVWQVQLIETIEDYLHLGSTEIGDKDRRVEAKLIAGMLLIAFDQKARQYLHEIGYKQDLVDLMSSSEAVIRATREQLQRTQDEYTKWALLPRQIAAEHWREAEEILRSISHISNIPDPATVLIGLLMPAMEASQSAATVAEQSIAFLATIEALRMYAAESGDYPQTLDGLPVPAFRDPATGKHFGYERISPTQAVLRRTKVRPGQPDLEVRITIRNSENGPSS